MGDFSELNRPQPPEETFDNSPIKLGEVKDFVRKARAKNIPGINGISYKLNERCPKVQASLWKLLQVVHIKTFIAKDWGLVDIIYIPKETNSKHLEQSTNFVAQCRGKNLFQSHC